MPCSWRVPVFEAILPNGPLVPVVGVVVLILRFGIAGVGWFRTFVASARNLRFIPSLILIDLLIDVFRLHCPGFSMMF